MIKSFIPIAYNSIIITIPSCHCYQNLPLSFICMHLHYCQIFIAIFIIIILLAICELSCLLHLQVVFFYLEVGLKFMLIMMMMREEDDERKKNYHWSVWRNNIHGYSYLNISVESCPCHKRLQPETKGYEVQILALSGLMSDPFGKNSWYKFFSLRSGVKERTISGGEKTCDKLAPCSDIICSSKCHRNQR